MPQSTDWTCPTCHASFDKYSQSQGIKCFCDQEKRRQEQEQKQEPAVTYLDAEPSFVEHTQLPTGDAEQPIAILSIARFDLCIGKKNNKPAHKAIWRIYLDGELTLQPDFTHAKFDPEQDDPAEVSQMILSDLCQVATGNGQAPPA